MKFKHFEFWTLTLGVIALGLFMAQPTLSYAAKQSVTWDNSPTEASTLSAHYFGEGGTLYQSVYWGAPSDPTPALCESGDPSSLEVGPIWWSVWVNSTSTDANISIAGTYTTSTALEYGFRRIDGYAPSVLKSDFGNSICQVGSGGQTAIAASAGSRFVSGAGRGAGSIGWSTLNSWPESITPAYYFSNVQPYQADPTISLNFPTATSTPEFSNWVVSIDSPVTTDYQSQTVGVYYYKNSTSTSPYLDSYTGYVPTVNLTENFPIPKSRPLWVTPETYPVTWYARAFYTVRRATTTAPYFYAETIYSDYVQFSLNPTTQAPAVNEITETAGPFSPNIYSVGYTPTSTQLSIDSAFLVDCSAYDDADFFSSSTIGALGCYARQTGLWLIGQLVIPPNWVKTYMSNSLEVIKNSFPFNYVFTVVDTVSAVAGGDLPSEDIVLTIPQLGISVDIMTTSTLSDIVGTSTAEKVFDAQTAIIWIAVVWAIVGLIL